MLLTRASEYALLSLDQIRKSDKPVGAEQLANNLNIPKSFLAKIMQSLAKQGILESKKGAHGGFLLTKDLGEITLYSVITAAEGKPPAVLDCTQYIGSCPSGVIGTCSISPFLHKFQDKIDDFLYSLTLKDIL
ncbi:MAG: Rrf2 family transcriptional regulator [Campylobacterota bacterium]|nr:Rrf2 family transcriptional regulator [Campylobacterota bacterium]